MESAIFQDLETELLRPVVIDLNGNKLIFKYGGDGNNNNNNKAAYKSKENNIDINSNNSNNESSSNNSGSSKWRSEGTDLERATEMVSALTVELKKAIEENNSMQSSLHEINETNSVILDMLISERQKNYELERDKTAYKEELTSALKTIIQLRKKSGKKSTNE